jgi:hypothetical protein
MTLLIFYLMIALSGPAFAQTNEQQPATEQTTPAEAAQQRQTTGVDDISDYGWFGLIGLLGLVGLIPRRSIVVPVRHTQTDAASARRDSR